MTGYSSRLLLSRIQGQSYAQRSSLCRALCLLYNHYSSSLPLAEGDPVLMALSRKASKCFHLWPRESFRDFVLLNDLNSSLPIDGLWDGGRAILNPLYDTLLLSYESGNRMEEDYWVAKGIISHNGTVYSPDKFSLSGTSLLKSICDKWIGDSSLMEIRSTESYFWPGIPIAEALIRLKVLDDYASYFERHEHIERSVSLYASYMSVLSAHTSLSESDMPLYRAWWELNSECVIYSDTFNSIVPSSLFEEVENHLDEFDFRIKRRA